MNNGAAYSYLDSLNENPFHKSAANGHLECLTLLVNANRGHNSKRIINQQNVLGSTPLHRVSLKQESLKNRKEIERSKGRNENSEERDSKLCIKIYRQWKEAINNVQCYLLKQEQIRI